MQTGHGNDIYDFANKIRCDFSSNIPYRNASGIIAEHLKGCTETISNYPDPSARRLASQLSDFHTTPTENILITNGSAEAFYVLAHLFQNRKSVIPYPSFSEYEDACRAHRHKISFLPLESLTKSLHKIRRFHANRFYPDSFKTDRFKVDDFKATHLKPSHIEAETVWFGVPNNPDGTIIPNAGISRLCHDNPHTYFIVDAAYDNLCPRKESINALHGKFKNLITVHSLTKTFGIPGLRLGYIIADQQIINGIRLLRPPWSVNALALEAGSFIMDNWHTLLPDSISLSEESAQLQQRLAVFPQLEVTPSPCNFFLVRMKVRTAAELKQYLIEQSGLLIRDASNFRGLSAQHFRISVQEDAWNQRLIEALELFFEK